MDLSPYLKGILRWWWLILLSPMVAGAASYYVTSQQPLVYQTTVTLLVGQVTQQANLSASDFNTIEQLAGSYAQIAVRQPVLQATVDSLELQMGWQSLKPRVYASPVPGTQLLAITVNDLSPKRAVAIADQIAIQLILQTPTSLQAEQRSERGGFVKSQLDALETRIQTAQTRVKELQAELDTAFTARQIQDFQTEINGLETLIGNWQKNYTELLSFFEGGDSPNYLTVIEPAQLPTEPVSPKVELNVLLAAAVGFVLALGAALLLEYIDDTIKSPDAVSRALGLTSLGSIARIKGESHKDILITSSNPYSQVSEAYRLVRANIQFMGVDQPIKSFMISSASPDEGKTTTVANLAIVMAQAGHNTIIVDADLRQPSLHRIFRVPNSEGMTDLLRSPELNIDDQLKHTGIENLQLITSGSLPPNPSELLGSKRMLELRQRLEEQADIIIFDSPPILAVTDALVASNVVGGVILVVNAGRTRRDVVKQAVKRLDRVGARILGTVLNQVSSRGLDYVQGSPEYYPHREYEAASQVDRPSQRRWWQRLPVLK